METTDQHKRNRMLIELVLIVIALAIVAYLLHVHTPKIIKLLRSGNISGLEQYIQNKGRRGRLVLILLQVIETITIVLPAMPVYICAGAIYGKIQGMLMCYITNLLMNVIIFLTARKLKISTAEFAKFQKNQKLEELMSRAKSPNRLVFLMCMLPVIPNGMIPYISAQTNVSLAGFSKALAVGSLPSIVVFVCCGDFLISEHFKITLPVVIILALLVGVFMLFRKRVTAWIEPKLKKLL